MASLQRPALVPFEDPIHVAPILHMPYRVVAQDGRYTVVTAAQLAQEKEEIRQLKEKMKEMEQRHKTDLKDLQDFHQDQISKLKHQEQREYEKLKKTSDQEINRLKSKNQYYVNLCTQLLERQNLMSSQMLNAAGSLVASSLMVHLPVAPFSEAAPIDIDVPHNDQPKE